MVQKSFDSGDFYRKIGDQCEFQKVGYYHSTNLGRISFVLPKVFMKDGTYTVFDGLTPHELLELPQKGNERIKNELNNIVFNFYRGLKHFASTVQDSRLINLSASYRLKHKAYSERFSYLDLVLSFHEFYKKHKDIILYKLLEAISPRAHKTNWNKTVSKQLPILTSNGDFIYNKTNIQVKSRDNTEILILLFYSILNHFNERHLLGLRIDQNIPFYKGYKFDTLRSTGRIKMKGIRYKYFSDVFKKMFVLVDMFFDTGNTGSTRSVDDFLCTNNYNVVFEEMVDHLLSDNFDSDDINSKEIRKLKNNKDGKIIDHIFKYKSLFDESEIYYIGDSKYYKPQHSSQGVSTYKQFTYTKNIIQHHITKINKGQPLSGKLRYRDHVTEGYNVTPNFFIYGYIDDFRDWQLNEVKSIGTPSLLSHFPDRLFDRDTLFVFEYRFNYLFILQAYIQSSADILKNQKNKFKESVYLDFKNWFLKNEKSNFRFYCLKDSQTDFSKNNLYGKCYKTVDNRIMVAIPKTEDIKNYPSLEFYEF